MGFIYRQRQSVQQIGALFLLIIAAVLLSIGEGSSKGSGDSNPDRILFHGIIPVLVASVLSGLASALCQWASQVCGDFLVYLGINLQETILYLCVCSFLSEVFSFYHRLRNTHHT